LKSGQKYFGFSERRKVNVNGEIYCGTEINANSRTNGWSLMPSRQCNREDIYYENWIRYD